MSQCKNEKIGNLITFFEMNLLSQKNTLRFEKHLLQCQYCQQELERSRKVIPALKQNKEAIAVELENRGISIENDRRFLTNKLREEQKSTLTISNGIRESFKKFMNTRVIIPVGALIAGLIIFLILRPSIFNANPYLKYLSYEKPASISASKPQLSISPMFERGVVSQSAQWYSQGLQLLRDDKFTEAAENLKKAVDANPEKGRYWLNLGICYYLNHQSVPAIEALSKAQELTGDVFLNTSRWYLAQAYLQNNESTEAIQVLETLSSQKYEYSEEAKALLAKIR